MDAGPRPAEKFWFSEEELPWRDWVTRAEMLTGLQLRQQSHAEIALKLVRTSVVGPLPPNTLHRLKSKLDWTSALSPLQPRVRSLWHELRDTFNIPPIAPNPSRAKKKDLVRALRIFLVRMRKTMAEAAPLLPQSVTPSGDEQGNNPNPTTAPARSPDLDDYEYQNVTPMKTTCGRVPKN